MRISSRLYKIAELVGQGETAADIGTDHGYVPMLLIKEGRSPHVIMSDISEASLSKARETFRQCGIPADESDFRVGDGLETIDKSEVDVVIIAGLGGHTIADILDADAEKTKSFNRLILQPRKHSGALRYYLFTHGWDICSEVLAKEGKFECEIITAEVSEENERNAPYPADDIRWKYPREMAASDPELARKRVEWKIGSINEQLDNMRSAGSDKLEMIRKLENDRIYLRELISSNNGKE